MSDKCKHGWDTDWWGGTIICDKCLAEFEQEITRLKGEVERLTTKVLDGVDNYWKVCEENDTLKARVAELENPKCLSCREPVERQACDECAPRLSAGYRDMALMVERDSYRAELETIAFGKCESAGHRSEGEDCFSYSPSDKGMWCNRCIATEALGGE